MRQGLVIAGSDRRGTAYGVFEFSRGHRRLAVVLVGGRARRGAATRCSSRPGAHRQGPPSVKYRGIFINDEDWGLQPWAAKNFEPGAGEVRDIGPKTYAQALRAAAAAEGQLPLARDARQHEAVQLLPENKVVADDYAIVMGSSHAEPMLRNNVGEWPRDQAKSGTP